MSSGFGTPFGFRKESDKAQSRGILTDTTRLTASESPASRYSLTRRPTLESRLHEGNADGWQRQPCRRGPVESRTRHGPRGLGSADDTVMRFYRPLRTDGEGIYNRLQIQGRNMQEDANGEYSEYIDERFSFLFDPRASKPRETGISFIQAAGPFYAVEGEMHLRSLLEYAGAWIDWYKFTVAANVVQPPDLVERKLELLGEHDVEAFPGGNFLEIAVDRGVESEWLSAMEDVGIPRIEVSSSKLDMAVSEKAALIERIADRGFHVHGEVGRKISMGEERTSIDRVIEEMNACLDAGADKVIFESDEVEAAFTDSDGELDDELTESLFAVADEVGAENIVFEVPLTQETEVMEAAAWFVRNVGPDVNLGNVNPHYINGIEQMRRGVHVRLED